MTVRSQDIRPRLRSEQTPKAVRNAGLLALMLPILATGFLFGAIWWLIGAYFTVVALYGGLNWLAWRFADVALAVTVLLVLKLVVLPLPLGFSLFEQGRQWVTTILTHLGARRWQSNLVWLLIIVLDVGTTYVGSLKFEPVLVGLAWMGTTPNSYVGIGAVVLWALLTTFLPEGIIRWSWSPLVNCVKDLWKEYR